MEKSAILGKMNDREENNDQIGRWMGLNCSGDLCTLGGSEGAGWE